jgi:hypothetical protein
MGPMTLNAALRLTTTSGVTMSAFISMVAVMQALTNDPKWVTRTNGLLAATGTFFQNNVMAEKCEQGHLQRRPAQLQDISIALAG